MGLESCADVDAPVLMGCSALQMHGDSRALSPPLEGKVSPLAPVLLAADQPYHAPRNRPTPEGDVAALGTPVQPPGAGEGTQEEHVASETAHSCVVMKLPPLNEGASSHCYSSDGCERPGPTASDWNVLHGDAVNPPSPENVKSRLYKPPLSFVKWLKR